MPACAGMTAFHKNFHIETQQRATDFDRKVLKMPVNK